MYKIKIEKFEGPLDLLLQIIEREELNISDISLAEVTEQYLHYLEENSDLPPEDLADFLVVAAKLLLLKSRILLPQLFFENEEDGDNLTKQLTIYRAYLEASRFIAARFVGRNVLYARERPFILEAASFSPPTALPTATLHHVFENILRDLSDYIKPMPELISRSVSLKEKIASLRTLLESKRQINFGEVLASANTRMDVIVAFLALLELVKQRHVVAEQANHGGVITLVHSEVLIEA